MHRYCGFLPSTVLLCLLALSSLHAADPSVAVLEWIDNSLNEDGFLVERSTDFGPFLPLAKVPANTVRYEDSAVKPSRYYSYRVRAYNDMGISGHTNVSEIQIPGPLSYADWFLDVSKTSFLTALPSSPNEALLHPDLPNIVCFAHGIDPHHPNRKLLPTAELKKGKSGQPALFINFALQRYATGIEQTLLISHDLKSWNPSYITPVTVERTATHLLNQIELPPSTKPTYWKFEYTLLPND